MIEAPPTWDTRIQFENYIFWSPNNWLLPLQKPTRHLLRDAIAQQTLVEELTTQMANQRMTPGDF